MSLLDNYTFHVKKVLYGGGTSKPFMKFHYRNSEETSKRQYNFKFNVYMKDELGVDEDNMVISLALTDKNNKFLKDHILLVTNPPKTIPHYPLTVSGSQYTISNRLLVEDVIKIFDLKLWESSPNEVKSLRLYPELLEEKGKTKVFKLSVKTLGS